MTKNFRLSSRGLQNCKQCHSINDFRFIVGDKTYECSSFFADFISPKIAKIHTSDRCANSFKLDIEDPNALFPKVLDMMHGKKVKINLAERNFFIKVGLLLENPEIILKFSDVIDSKITVKNLLTLLEEKLRFGLDVTNEIDLIASRFYEYDTRLIKMLGLSIISRILNSPHLVIQKEDSLLDFVISLISEDETYRELLGAIDFTHLSAAGVAKFNKLMRLEDISLSVWEGLKERLAQKVEPIYIKDRYLNSEILISYSRNPFNGIFTYLRQSAKGLNPVDAHLVEITTGDNECTVNAKELLNYPGNPRWYLTERENNWVCFKFLHAQVSIDGYTWSSGTDSSYWEYPVSWTWEGSNDNNTWVTIDRHDDNTDMGGNEKTHTWTCTKSPLFRSVRFRLRRVTRHGGLYSTQLELFGGIKLDKLESD